MSLKDGGGSGGGLAQVVVSMVDSFHAWVHRIVSIPTIAPATTTATTTTTTVGIATVATTKLNKRGLRSGFWFTVIGTTTVVLGVVTYLSVKRRRQFHRRRRQLLERRRDEEASALESGHVPPEHWSLFVDGQFVNPYPGWHDHTLWDVLRWWFGRPTQHKPSSDKVHVFIK
ncbi:hypothetical protein BDF19DRAFT_157461 [Syncephalis fuscata]|nr:hypothetical protein BDF19DRAFT_157461 [Syncephalis fuscata]